jgi:predicted nuclease with TOPRIM domain
VPPSVQLAILSQIDMDEIHPNVLPNTELELYISGLKYLLENGASSTIQDHYHKLQEENKMLKEIQTNITTQYNQTAELTKKIQIEGKKWRSKHLQAEQKIHVYEKQISQLKKQLQEQINLNIPENIKEDIPPLIQACEHSPSEDL